MGKWMQVKCSCPKRKPLPNSQRHEESYRNKHKTTQQAKIAEEWRESVYQMYECGHRDGMILQFTPSDFFIIGLALDVTFKESKDKFEIFRKISNWRLYDDHYLSLAEDEVILWELEIEQLKLFLSKEQFMNRHEFQLWQKFWQSNELLYNDIEKTLENGLNVCRASLQTKNPVEFFW